MGRSKAVENVKKVQSFQAASKFVTAHISKINIAVFIIGVLVYGYWSVSLGQDNSWDLRNYHYYNVFSLIGGRLNFDYAPAQLQTFLNPIIELPFYFLTKILKPIHVGFIMGGIQGINFFLIFAIAYRILSKKSPFMRFLTAFISAGVGMYGPVTLTELGATQNDLFISLLVLGSILAAIKSQKESEYGISKYHRNRILGSGLLVGMAVGFKLTAAIYLIGMLPALFVLVNGSVRLHFIMYWIGGAFIGVVLTDGYWMFMMWNTFGNPLFPFYNAIFQSPYYDLNNIQDLRFMPKSLSVGLVLPFHFLYQNDFTYLSKAFRDARYAIIYTLSIIFVLKILISRKMPKNKNYKSDLYRSGLTPDQLFLLLFFFLSYIIWQVQFSVIRYITPLEHLGPLLIVLLISYLIKNVHLQRLSMLILFSLIVFVAKPLGVERLLWQEKYFNVSVPKIDSPENTIVVIAGKRPWAYMIPSFPESVRFLRIGGNFTGSKRKNNYISEMKSIIKKHTGVIYLLSRRKFLEKEVYLLRSYRLFMTQSTPRLIRSIHERPGLFLWQLEKK